MTPRARARAAILAHAPDLTRAELTELGRGLDSTAFLAQDLVVRVAEDHDVAREAALLHHIGPTFPIAVPVPRFVDEHHGVIAYPVLPGVPLLGRDPPARAARTLGRAIRALHDLAPASVADLVVTDPAEPGDWLDGLVGPADLVATVRAEVPLATRQLVLCHADLGAEHILELAGELSGIIDWSDAAITDPALDLARLLRDFGPAFLDEVLAAHGDLPGAMARIRFFARCAALEDLEYGRTTGRSEYVVAATRSLGWLFPR